MKNIILLLTAGILLPILLSFAIHKSDSIFPSKSEQDEYIIKILDTSNNKIIKMQLEEYVWRVAAKEIPVSFHDEALKSQIVAARTYAIRKMNKNTHNNADICTDHNHCSAFLAHGEEIKKFGNNYKTICKKLSNLAKRTKGQILTYNNEPILAVFHAISSGTTEKSSDVWQEQLPYLINIDSSVDKKVDGFATTICYTEDELKKILNIPNKPQIEIISRTDAGSVKSIKINNVIYNGNDIRTLLKLRSCNFNIEPKDGSYIFYVKGYGHGVGLSQCGANEYAKSGLKYTDILYKYYPGAKLENLNNLSLRLNLTK